MAVSAEDRALGRLRRRLQARGNRFLGDDAAVLPSSGAVIVTVDQQLEGVHFRPDLDPRTWGRRLVRIALSDVAAMGGEPRFAFLAVQATPTLDVDRLLAAVADECELFGAALAGGDLASSRTQGAGLTVIGARAERGRFVGRHGARPGDRLWLGGPVGSSFLGRLALDSGFVAPRGLRAAVRRAVVRHLSPQPQLELGHWLARRRRAAAIDVSDGLALDLHRLCRESGVGAAVELAALPRQPRFADLAAALGHDERLALLAGGEDYVLLFTLPPRVAPPEGLGCQAIGRITPTPDIVLVTASGRSPLAADGWDHLNPDRRPDEG